MTHSFHSRERVAFSETDLAGIMHFSNFFRIMERVEHAFLRSLGSSVLIKQPDQAGMMGWPRIHSSCDYHAPLFFDEEFDVELLIEELRSKSITYLFKFRKTNTVLAALGKITVVCAVLDLDKQKMTPVPIPASLLELIEVAPSSILHR